MRVIPSPVRAVRALRARGRGCRVAGVQMQPSARRAGALPLLRLALAGLLLAAPAAAIDPTTAAFRKQAKDAQKVVRAETKVQVKAVKTGLKAALQSYQAGESELPAAIRTAVTAATSAIASLTTTATDEADALSTSGADMLAGFTGTVERDFLEGGAGAWDEYRERAERFLDRSDGKIRKEFAKFVKGVDKQASELGFEPDVRWRVFGHDPGPLLAVDGPAIRAFTPPAPPPPGTGVGSGLVITVEARFLTADDDVLQEIGVDFRGFGSADVRVTENDGTEALVEELLPGTDGTAVLQTTLSRTLDGPVRTRLFEAGASEPLFESLGSRPTGADAVQEILQSFKQDLGQELKFGGQKLGQNSKFVKSALNVAAKAHKTQQITTAAALQAGASTLATATSSTFVPDEIEGDCFWLSLVTRNPVTNASLELGDAGLTDADVFADLVPDGGGQYTRFLERLDRKVAAHDRRRARAVSRYVSKIGKQAAKQGESLETTVQARYRPAQTGTQLQVVPSLVTDPVADPTIQLAITARLDDVILAYLAGLAKAGLSSTEPEMEESNGMYVLLGAAVKDASKAFWADVPDLADLPTVGWHFKTKNTNKARQDLIIMVTPRIVVTDGET